MACSTRFNIPDIGTKGYLMTHSCGPFSCDYKPAQNDVLTKPTVVRPTHQKATTNIGTMGHLITHCFRHDVTSDLPMNFKMH